MVVGRLWIAAICLAGASAFAQPSVMLESEHPTVSAGHTFSLIVTVTDGAPGRITFPNVPDLRIDARPASVNTVIKSINGKTSHSVVQYFRAQVDEPGIIEIPPFVVDVNGTPFSSNSLSLQVIKPSDRAGPSLEDGVIVESRVNATEVFEGEAITLTVELWELDIVHSKGAFQFPSTVGFYALPQEPEQVGVASKERGGLSYQVAQYMQVLYPTRSGELVIGPCQWSGLVQGVTYYEGVRQRIQAQFVRGSDAIKVAVKPLPSRPPGFSGAVGEFELHGALSRNEVIQGVPVTLTLRLVGNGNPHAITEPSLPELDWAYVADPVHKEGVAGFANNGLREQRFEYAITPYESGRREIPPVRFVYFDPKRASYETCLTGPFSLNVAPSGESDKLLVYDSSEDDPPSSVDIVDIDVLPIITTESNLGRNASARYWMVLLAVLPVLVYACAAVYAARRRRFASDHGFARAYRAKAIARRELDSVAASEQAASTIHRILIRFIADTFNVGDAGMTSYDADQLLRDRGIDPELCRNVQTILRKCERAVYASTQLPSDEIQALIHGAAAFIDRLKSPVRKSVS